MTDTAKNNASPWSDQQLALVRQSGQPENAEAYESHRSYFRMRRLATVGVTGVMIVIMFMTMVGNEVPGWGVAKAVLVFAWVLTFLCVLGLVGGRTLSVDQVLSFFLMGYFLIPIITVWIMRPLVWLLTDRIASVLVVPIVEEVLKAVPVLWLGLISLRDRLGGRTLFDFTLAGFAVGAGFMLREDLLWARDLMNIEGPFALLVPWGYMSFGISGGHPAWTALIGFSVGLVIVFTRWLWVLIPAGFLTMLAVLEHIGWNNPWRFDVLALTLYGLVPLVFMMLAFVVAVAQGVHLRMWARQHDHMFRYAPIHTHWPWKRAWWQNAAYNRQLTRIHMSAWRVSVRPGASPVDPQAFYVLHQTKSL